MPTNWGRWAIWLPLIPTSSGLGQASELHHEFGVIDKLGARRYWLKDQLGSVRAVVRDGAVVEWNDYYAYGAVRDGATWAGDGRWKYLGKELDNETATQHLDAREYDPFVSFLQIDPLWAKYPSLSPYTYVAGNPLTRVDPTGLDWYKTSSGVLYFNSSVKSQEDLAEGLTYVGATYFEKTKNGNVSYRNDGSIEYSNQTDGYQRIVNTPKYVNPDGSEKKVEQFAFLMEKGVLVTPDANNKPNESSPFNDGYDFGGNFFVDNVTGETREYIATIHTHPDKIGIMGSDVNTFGKFAPGKAFYVLSLADGVIYAALPYKSDNKNSLAPPYDYNNRTLSGILSTSDLLSGYDFRKFIKSSTFTRDKYIIRK